MQDLDSSKNDWIRGKLLKETDDSSWQWDLPLGSIESSIPSYVIHPRNARRYFLEFVFRVAGNERYAGRGQKT